MAKHNKKGRSKTNGGFICLFHRVVDCLAWQQLKPTDKTVYLLLARKYNGFNNGYIALSIREAARNGRMAPGTARKAFSSLIEYGFIKCRQRGSFDWKKSHASEWELTQWPRGVGIPATHNYIEKSREILRNKKQSTVSKRHRNGAKSSNVIRFDTDPKL